MPDLNDIRDTTVRSWLRDFKNGTLTFDHFHEHWKNWMFKTILPPQKDAYAGPIIETDLLKSVLIQSLEDFIFFENKSILKTAKNLPICGRIFEKGDFLFRCLDCGVDSTCALCAPCFKNSIHKCHDFKIEILQKHGCCDCGDTLCWKNGSHCEEHQEDSQILSTKLICPQELISRASIVINSIFRFIKIMIDNCCDGDTNDNHYCTVLYDHRSFHPEGTKNLNIQILCGVGEDADLSRVCQHLFHEGWVMFLYSSYEECDQMKCKLENKIKCILELKVVSWDFIVRQILTMKLLSWLVKISKKTKNLLDLVTVIGLNSGNYTDVNSSVQELEDSYVEHIFLNSSYLFKSVKLECYRLFISAMQADFENKKAFATVFFRSYGKLMKSSILDFQPFSFDLLSIQLFNDNLLTEFLIEQEDIISVLLNIFYSLCLEKNHSLYNTAILESYKNLEIRFLDSLKYILSSPPRKWTGYLMDRFLNGIQSFLKVLSSGEVEFSEFHGVEGFFDKKVKSAVYGKLTSVIKSILIWCSTDKAVCLETFRLTLDKVCELREEGMTVLKCLQVETGRYSSKFPPCHGFNKQVWSHMAIMRFLSDLVLILSTLGHRCSFKEICVLTPELILDLLLKLDVQCMNYNLSPFLDMFPIFDSNNIESRDIILIQMCAALMEENKFLLHILQKFLMLDLISIDSGHGEYNLQRCLSLIITVISNRWNAAVADATTDECLKYEMIETLLRSSPPRAKLTNMFVEKGYGIQEVNAAIDQFSTIEKLEYFQHEVCILKKESISDFVEFQDNSILKQEESSPIYTLCHLLNWYPRKLPKFTGVFQSISKMLYCDVMLLLMSTILKRSQIKLSSGSDGDQLLDILYLIGLALQEEDSHVTAFINAAEKWNLKSLIESLVDIKHLENERASLLWVLDRYRSLVDGSPPNETRQCAQEIPPCTPDIAEEMNHLPNLDVDFKFIDDKKVSILDKMSALQKKLFTDHSSTHKLFSSGIIEETLTDKNKNPTVSCILCLKEETVTQGTSLMVCSAFVLKSKVLNANYEKAVGWTSFFGLTVPFAVHIDSCGHVMHKTCWDELMKSTAKSTTVNSLIYATNMLCLKDVHNASNNPGSVDSINNNKLTNEVLSELSFVNKEFTCPVCKVFSNAVVPFVQPLMFSMQSEQTFTDWLKTTLVATGNNFEVPFPKSREFCEHEDTVFGSNNTELTAASRIRKAIDISADNEEPEGTRISVDLPSKQAYLMETLVSTLCTECEIASIAENKFLLVWLSCSYRIHTTERFLKITNKPLLGALDFKQKSSIESLVKLSSTILDTYKDKLEKLDLQNKIWSAILKLHGSSSINIFLWDCFDLVFSLALRLSSSNISNGALPDVMFDINAFRFILLINFAQTLLFTDINEFIFLETDVISDDTDCLASIVRKFKNCDGVNTVAIWNLLKSSSLPFLRCSAIFYHFLTGMDHSKQLNEIGGDTYETILCFLGIPIGCKDLFDCPYVKCIFDNWASLKFFQSPKVGQQISNINKDNILVDLPTEYSELIYHVSNFSCPAWTDEDIRCPTICLSCGQILCSNEHFTQHKLNDLSVGFCMYHSYVCGGGHGIFLRVKPNVVIFLSSSKKRGNFLPSPYVDDNSNSDESFCKANKLRLCPTKYTELKDLWLRHSLHKEMNSQYGSIMYSTKVPSVNVFKNIPIPKWHLI